MRLCVLLAFAVGCVPASAQWGSCQTSAGRPAHGWYHHGDDRETFYRYDRGRLVETWRAPAVEQAAPETPPAMAAKKKDGENFGLDWTPPDAERYAIGGKTACKKTVFDAIEASVPDDSSSLRLTVIGPGREAVLKDVGESPALAPYRGKLVARSYDASHWHVRDAGFRTDGAPTIYVQAPGGKVLHRQDDYRDGAEGLGTALRRSDPNYDPAKDPDLRQQKPLPPGPLNPPVPGPAPDNPLAPIVPPLPTSWQQLVQWLIALGILLFRDRIKSGVSGLFGPRKQMSPEELAAIVDAILKKQKDEAK